MNQATISVPAARAVARPAAAATPLVAVGQIAERALRKYFRTPGVLLDRPGKDCRVFFFYRKGREFACGQVLIGSD